MADVSGTGILGTGGPPPTQFLQAIQSITTALNGETAALNALLAAILPTPLLLLALSPIPAPAAPASGSIIFVDVADQATKVINSLGIVTTIAP